MEVQSKPQLGLMHVVAFPLALRNPGFLGEGLEESTEQFLGKKNHTGAQSWEKCEDGLYLSVSQSPSTHGERPGAIFPWTLHFASPQDVLKHGREEMV